MISAIIPVYNVKPYLAEAIESVTNQTFKDLEIILVDDGSTDGSGDMCDEYARNDSRIKVIHQKNRGLSAARNAGLDICKGDCVVFLDSDDAYLPEMVSKSSEMMAKHGADVVECNICLHRNAEKHNIIGISSTKEGLYPKNEALVMQLDGRISTKVWNKLYKRELWNTIRFPEGQNYEDIDIILPLLAQAESVYVISEPLILHRTRPDSITGTQTLKNISDKSLSHKHYVQYIKEHIPEYFTQEELDGIYQRIYIDQLADHFVCASSKSPEKKELKAFLKERIRETRSNIDLSKCNRRIKAASFMYSNLPWAIPAFYHVYRPVRLFASKLLNR